MKNDEGIPLENITGREQEGLPEQPPLSYMEQRMAFINAGRPLAAKKTYRLKPVSEKRAAKIEAQKASGDDILDRWFDDRREEMTGVCQCGCAEPSQKKDDVYFRYCICHIFPKRIFESITTHPLNWVERKFWEGHHTNFDEQGMDRWPMMADWEDIKAKFRILSPLLTDQERATKFYRTLADLVETN